MQVVYLHMHVRKMLVAVIDILLPRPARSVRTDARSLCDLRVAPQKHNACGISITTLMDYRNEAVEDCIQALKYDASSHAAALLAEVLGDYLREEISHMRIFSSRQTVLVPIPLHKERLRERGFNQIERVLTLMPDEFKDGHLAHINAGALVRIRPTPPQTRRPRAERLTNVAGAFAAPAANERGRGAHVFLIDDVTTTGATLAEAARALEKTGVIVSPLALARA